MHTANLYVTADAVGDGSGGGSVAYHEVKAMDELGSTAVLDRSVLNPAALGLDPASPWSWDFAAYLKVKELLENDYEFLRAHFYSGTFTRTIKLLIEANPRLGMDEWGHEERQFPITYSVDPHDIKVSREEHEALGMPYPLHLTDPRLWDEYVEGYRLADKVICPSRRGCEIMKAFGCTNADTVIPHGCVLPERVALPPKTFTVGYLGQCGPDKGLRYLLQAWKELALKDGLLLLAGSGDVMPLVRAFGGGNIQVVGRVLDAFDLYNACTVYCQPSTTEGFACEVLEAMAHGRPVICSDGAGASECVGVGGIVVPARNVEALKNAIKEFCPGAPDIAKQAREIAAKFTWDRMRASFKEVWNA